MKIALSVIILVLSGFQAVAQQGRIHIEQDPKIDALLDIYSAADSVEEFYTIQVGFGSFDKAEKLKAQVDVDYPGWYSKIIFDSPTYRVHVGKFKSKLEAERIFLEVRKKYPESLLLTPENASR